MRALLSNRVSVRSYFQLARFHRPQAIGLILLPGWWSIVIASPQHPDWLMLLLFAFGAILTRSAGCVYNDMVDRDIDRQVTRTRLRPLAQGVIQRKQAALFGLVLLILAASLLVFLPLLTFLLAIIATGLITAYPWMKRITYWPQAFLGLAFNWGALMGWTAVRGALEAPALLFYGGGFFWTLVYDTLYAHQDKNDDLPLGIGSTALLFPHRSRTFLGICAFLSVAFFLSAGWVMKLPWAYFLSVIGVSFHYLWQISTVNLDDPLDCGAKFVANNWIGWILLAGIFASRY